MRLPLTFNLYPDSSSIPCQIRGGSVLESASNWVSSLPKEAI